MWRPLLFGVVTFAVIIVAMLYSGWFMHGDP